MHILFKYSSSTLFWFSSSILVLLFRIPLCASFSLCALFFLLVFFLSYSSPSFGISFILFWFTYFLFTPFLACLFLFPKVLWWFCLWVSVVCFGIFHFSHFHTDPTSFSHSHLHSHTVPPFLVPARPLRCKHCPATAPSRACRPSPLDPHDSALRPLSPFCVSATVTAVLHPCDRDSCSASPWPRPLSRAVRWPVAPPCPHEHHTCHAPPSATAVPRRVTAASRPTSCDRDRCSTSRAIVSSRSSPLLHPFWG